MGYSHWSRRNSNAAAGLVGHLLGRKIGQRMRFKSGGSSTRTLVNEGSGDDQTTGVHSGFATLTKRISLGHPWNKRCVGSAKIQLTEVTQTVIKDTSGIQIPGVVAACNTTKQAMVSSAAAGSAATVAYDQGSVRLFDLNQNRASTGSAWWTANPTPRQDQLFVGNVVMQTDIRNFSSVGVIVDLYYCTPNQNTNQDPLVVWNTVLRAASDSVKPLNGYPPAGSTGGFAGAAQYTMPGLRPSQIAGFRQTWKILHTHHMCLGASASESITMNINTNYLLDYKKILSANGQTDQNFTFTNANVTSNFLRHGSVVVFAVQRGEIILDTTTSAVATYAGTDVGYVTSKRYCLKMLAGNGARLDSQVVDSNIPTGTLLANQKHVDMDDDLLPVVQG